LKVKNSYVADRFADVEQALAKASAWSAQDAELGAYLAGYLVVLISGVFEDCAERLICDRADRAGDPELACFIRRRLSLTFRNPTPDKIRDVLKDFDSSYHSKYRKRVPSEAEEALASIVTNKNHLAHGTTAKMQVTIADVDGYFQRSNQVLAALEDVLA